MLFASILEFVTVVIVLYIFYSIFIADSLKARSIRKKRISNITANVNKIALVKLASNSVSDIESFIEKNAEYLSQDVVKQLVNRIEYLNADSYLKANDRDDDENLRMRIDSLAQDDHSNEQVSNKLF